MKKSIKPKNAPATPASHPPVLEANADQRKRSNALPQTHPQSTRKGPRDPR